jgi:hypothetical protein
MNYAVEMDSGAMIHTQSFIEVYSAFRQELVGGEGDTGTQTQTAWRAHTPTLIF